MSRFLEKAMSVVTLGNSLRSGEKQLIKNNGRTSAAVVKKQDSTAVVKKQDSSFTTTTETQNSLGEYLMQYLIDKKFYLVQLNA